jgi:PadR family transcriptional regulator, regulatory protein PadR
VPRRSDGLTPLQADIVRALVEAAARGEAELHGAAVARRIGRGHRATQLVTQGSVYQSLGRLRARGLVSARWEDAEVAADERRPRRRYYRPTAHGQDALAGTDQAPRGPRVDRPSTRRGARPGSGASA